MNPKLEFTERLPYSRSHSTGSKPISVSRTISVRVLLTTRGKCKVAFFVVLLALLEAFHSSLQKKKNSLFKD